MKSLETVIASLRQLQIPEQRPNLNTNALLGVIAAKYGTVARDQSDVSSSNVLEDGFEPSVGEPWWNYVLCCLDCLRHLVSVLQPAFSEKPRLSLHQVNMVKERLEFIVALGLHPHLDVGVGLPLSSRLYSAEQYIPPCKGLCIKRVQLIVDGIMQMYEHTELRTIILPNFLHDLLIGLLTLSFSPQVREDRPLVNRYQSRLRRVTTCGTPPVRDIIREIFVIQGSIGQTKSKLSQAPNWLRFACSQVLTKQMEKMTDGVLPLVLGFFDFAGPHGREAEKCSAIAEVIIRPPKLLSGPALDTYWNRIIRQVIPLMENKGETLLIRFAVSFINAFSKSYPEKSTSFILPYLFVPEIVKLNNVRESENEEILTYQEVQNLFQRLDKFISNSFDICEFIINHLTNLLPLMFFSAAYLSPKKSLALTLAKGILTAMTAEKACERLNNLIFEEHSDPSQTLCLKSNEDGELSVRKWNGVGPRANGWGVDEEKIVETTYQILSTVSTPYQGKFFILLLRKLNEMITKESQLEIRICEGEGVRQHRPDLLLALLSLIAEKFPDCCISQPEHIVEIAKETLIRAYSTMEYGTDESATDFMKETVSISLGLVTSVLATSMEETDSSKKESLAAAFSSVLPVVTKIADSYLDSGLQQLAGDLRMSILTQGHVGLERDDTRNPLIEEISVENQQLPEELQQAFNDANSSVIPMRGHALIVLSRAVEEKKPQIDGPVHRQSLLRVFLEAAGHSDSYVYLPAVRGLTALADNQPKSMLPYLLDRLSDVKLTEDEQRAEYRLKLGEAIMRCVRSLGEAVPQYRERLLNAFLARCRLESRPMLRAAAVSNLAEVCRLLKFSLHTCLHEVLNAASNLLSGDDSPEVRSAAAYLLLSLLRGVDQDVWKIIGGVALRDIYRLLRRCEGIEKDESVHKVILLTCNELDDIVHASLLLDTDIRPVKEIRIL